jgi:hypothetical protein
MQRAQQVYADHVEQGLSSTDAAARMLAELRLDPLQCLVETIPAAFVSSTGKRRSEDAVADAIPELVRTVIEERRQEAATPNIPAITDTTDADEPAPEQTWQEKLGRDLDFNGSWYDVLGISPGAAKRAIGSAYRSLCLFVHPDKGGDALVFARVTFVYQAGLKLSYWGSGWFFIGFGRGWGYLIDQTTPHPQ